MIGVLSDAHGNFPAFEQAIDILQREGAEQFVFLGDAIGYFPSTAVICAVQKMGEDVSCICGNHEDILLSGIIDPEREPVYQHQIIRHQLSQTQLELIKSWPAQSVEAYGCGVVLFVHGSPLEHINGYVYPDTDLSVFHVDEKLVFMGHTHHPFVGQSGRTTFVNVGSCGLPRDHGSLGSAALFDESTGSVRIVRFDITNATQRALASMGPVHPLVHQILMRRSEVYCGEYIGI